ncbi:MAG: UrcA family protein [Caulobacteraceae bacterium]|nr:UrcA family protein [Caulobacteraceae bacterium]
MSHRFPSQSGPQTGLARALAPLGAAVLLTSAIATPARAEPEAPTQAVSVRGYDLGDPRDADRLLKRIGSAALEVCGASAFSFPDVRQAVARSSCWRDNVSQAVAQVGDGRLSAALRQWPAFAGPGAAGSGAAGR